MVEAIRIGLMEGKTNRQLARELGCTDGNIIFYTKTYLPELRSKLNHRKQLAKDVRRLTIEKMLNEGKTTDEISAAIGLTRTVTLALIVKLFPERNKFTIYEKNAKEICALYKDGKTVKEIVAITGVSYGNVSQTVKRELPDLFRERSAEMAAAREQYRTQFGDYLDAGMTAQEIANVTGKNLMGIIAYADDNYPDHPTKLKDGWKTISQQSYYQQNPDKLPEDQKQFINALEAEGKTADEMAVAIAKKYNVLEKQGRTILLRHRPELSKKRMQKKTEELIRSLLSQGHTTSDIRSKVGLGRKAASAIVRRLRGIMTPTEMVIAS